MLSGALRRIRVQATWRKVRWCYDSGFQARRVLRDDSSAVAVPGTTSVSTPIVCRYSFATTSSTSSPADVSSASSSFISVTSSAASSSSFLAASSSSASSSRLGDYNDDDDDDDDGDGSGDSNSNDEFEAPVSSPLFGPAITSSRSLQNIQWRSETIKEETTSVCLKREFSEEDARQLGLGRRIGVGRGYDSPVARETKTREPGLDASCPRQPGAEVCTQPVSPPSQLQLATFQHAASSRLYGLAA